MRSLIFILILLVNLEFSVLQADVRYLWSREEILLKVSQVEELQTIHGGFILDTPLGMGAKNCFVVVDGPIYRNRIEFMMDPTESALKEDKWEEGDHLVFNHFLGRSFYTTNLRTGATFLVHLNDINETEIDPLEIGNLQEDKGPFFLIISPYNSDAKSLKFFTFCFTVVDGLVYKKQIKFSIAPIDIPAIMENKWKTGDRLVLNYIDDRSFYVTNLRTDATVLVGLNELDVIQVNQINSDNISDKNLNTQRIESLQKEKGYVTKGTKHSFLYDSYEWNDPAQFIIKEETRIEWRRYRSQLTFLISPEDQSILNMNSWQDGDPLVFNHFYDRLFFVTNLRNFITVTVECIEHMYREHSTYQEYEYGGTDWEGV